MTGRAPLIGEFKARRQALGWSLREVGERCGIEERFLGDWERGSGSPRLDAVERWAGVLGFRLSLAPEHCATRRGLQVEWQQRRITVDGAPVRLTPMEWKALERLAATPGQLVSHEALFCHLYGAGQPYRAQSTAVRVLITKLRRLLPLRIEAQWGRGYVIRGIASSAPVPQAPGNGEPGADARADAAAPERHPDSLDAAPRGALTPSDRPQPRRSPVHGNVVAIGGGRGGGTTARRVALATAAAPASACRAEELGVIERFLAERGATRCPDMAMIQRAPLPTLVWDKTKRKWVRPAANEAHSAG